MISIRQYIALPFMALFALSAFAACEDDESAAGSLCDAGSNVFCRCRGGGAGTKACKTTGDGFGECETASGTCDEVEPSGSSSSGSGGGPPGGDPPQPEGELLGPCSEDADCKDGMTCPMGYCTMPCESYEDCYEANGDCINWEGSPTCMPYCIVQDDCEPFGMASRCGYTDDSVPSFDVVVCANWADNFQLPPDGYPPGVACDSDLYCNTGLEQVERVCDVDGCTDGCHVDTDCGDGQLCSESGGVLGTCGGVMMEDGDDCPGIPLSISIGNPINNVQGDTNNALPPSEHEVMGGGCVPGLVPSEELVYELSIGDSGNLIINLDNSDPNFDPQMYVRTGNCATGTQVACVDDGLGAEGEIFQFAVFQGETLYLFVDGWNGSHGPFTLSADYE